MNGYIEKDYISRAGLYLDKFSWSGPDLAVCRCPFCGDSRKNTNQRRHYFIRGKTGWSTYCHNCQTSYSLSNFLKVKFPYLYDEFIFEKYKGNRIVAEPELIIPDCKPVFSATRNEYYTPISELDKSHFAYQYISSRKIPEEFHSKLWFTDRFNELAHSLDCDEHKKYLNDSRIVIPSLTKSGALLHIAGRALDKDSPKRYYNVVLSKFPMIFGLWRINNNNRIYVTEGQFDSMFLPNCIAVSGTAMRKLNNIISPENRRNVTIVYDCQPRNKDVISGMLSCINSGYSVCIWNTHIDKDINQEIINGNSTENIKSLIDKSTEHGLSALIKLNDWRRC